MTGLMPGEASPWGDVAVRRELAHVAPAGACGHRWPLDAEFPVAYHVCRERPGHRAGHTCYCGRRDSGE